jgi:hypothetical protein
MTNCLAAQEVCQRGKISKMYPKGQSKQETKTIKIRKSVRRRDVLSELLRG